MTNNTGTKCIRPDHTISLTTMTEHHPTTPPDELINAWRAEGCHQDYCKADDYLYHKIAEWGYEQRGTDLEAELQKVRDEELEACCKAIADQIITVGNIGLSGPTGVLHRETHSSWPAFAQMVSRQLRAAMRPKPKSLKEQALGLLNEGPVSDLLDHEVAVIRRALESLPD